MDPTNPTLCVDGVFWSNVITLWCTFLMKTLEQYACSQKALWRYEGSPLPLSISSIHIDTSTILCKYDQPTVTSECVMINVTVTNCQPHLTSLRCESFIDLLTEQNLIQFSIFFYSNPTGSEWMTYPHPKVTGIKWSGITTPSHSINSIN